MANPAGKCIICGKSPTVKMHVFPRALMLELRGEEKHLVQGTRGRAGVRFRQNGVWDDRVLCTKHEEDSGIGDEYAITLCRRIPTDAALTETGGAYKIGNPRPDLLLRFIYATVWRQVVSTEGRQLNLRLGPYKHVIEGHLFRNEEAPLQALVGRSNLVMSDGKPARITIAPYRRRLAGWRTWHFQVGPLDVHLKTDSRPFPSDWLPYLANGNDPLLMPTIEPLPLEEAKILHPIFRQMNTRA